MKHSRTFRLYTVCDLLLGYYKCKYTHFASHAIEVTLFFGKTVFQNSDTLCTLSSEKSVATYNKRVALA